MASEKYVTFYQFVSKYPNTGQPYHPGIKFLPSRSATGVLLLSAENITVSVEEVLEKVIQLTNEFDGRSIRLSIPDFHANLECRVPVSKQDTVADLAEEISFWVHLTNACGYQRNLFRRISSLRDNAFRSGFLTHYFKKEAEFLECDFTNLDVQKRLYSSNAISFGTLIRNLTEQDVSLLSKISEFRNSKDSVFNSNPQFSSKKKYNSKVLLAYIRLYHGESPITPDLIKATEAYISEEIAIWDKIKANRPLVTEKREVTKEDVDVVAKAINKHMGLF